MIKKYKDIDGQVVNPYQKPPELAAWLVSFLCIPGSTVLVIGAGAGGGEVLGALLRGCNVVGIENNKVQYNSLHRHLLQVKDSLRADQVRVDAALSVEQDSIPESQAYSAGDQLPPSASQSSQTKSGEVCGMRSADG